MAPTGVGRWFAMFSMTDGLYNNTAYPRIQLAKIHFFSQIRKSTANIMLVVIVINTAIMQKITLFKTERK